MQRGVWEVTSKDIRAVGPEDAVSTFRDLLWAEAHRHSVEIQSIDVPSDIFTKDGGLDGAVFPIGPGHAPLLKESTGFQIKTGGKKFSAKDFVIREGSRRKRKWTIDDVLPNIKEFAEKNHKLVFVLFGTDLVNSKASLKKDIISLIRIHTSAKSYSKVSVLVANELTALVNHYPALAIKISQIPLEVAEVFRHHKSWQSDADMRQTKFYPDDVQQARIESIRQNLTAQGYTAPIYVSGEPGIGKTRGVLEAVTDVRFASLVLYSNNPRRALEVINHFLLPQSRVQAIIVIDECTNAVRLELENRLTGQGPRLRLITIGQQSGRLSLAGELNFTPISNESIRNILAEYTSGRAVHPMTVDICGGSPRMAHLLGMNLRENPNDPIQDRMNLFTACIRGDQTDASKTFLDRLFVLQCCSLFLKFGYKGRDAVEFTQIWTEIVAPLDSSVSQRNVQEIIEYFRELRIIQGNETLTLSPRLLHVWLWVGFWKRYGDRFDFSRVSNLSDGLQEWFGEMFQYSSEIADALPTIANLIDSGTIFPTLESLKKNSGSSLFLNLSRTLPENSLRWIQRHLSSKSAIAASRNEGIRRALVPSLEAIAAKSELFEGAANELLKLARFESEDWSNNATGTFQSLFAIEFGDHVEIESHPLQKLDYLKRLLAKGDSATIRIAISAIQNAIDDRHIRMVSETWASSRAKRNVMWRPKLWKDVFDVYGAYFIALVDAALSLPEPFASEAAAAAVANLRLLVRIDSLTEIVSDALARLAASSTFDRRPIIKALIEVLKYEGESLQKEKVFEIERVLKELSEGSLDARIERYIGLYLIEDRFDEKGGALASFAHHIEALAKELVQSPNRLREILDWLSSKEAQGAFELGGAIAKLDTLGHWQPKIAAAWQRLEDNASSTLLMGYLCERVLVDRRSVENLLLDLLRRTLPKDKVQSLPRLVAAVSPTQPILAAVIDVIQRHQIDLLYLEPLAYSRLARGQHDEDLIFFLKELQTINSSGSTFLAITALAFRTSGGPLSQSLRQIAGRLVVAHSLFHSASRGNWNGMIVHHWSRLVDVWIEENHENALHILDVMSAASKPGSSIAAADIKVFGKILLSAAQFNPAATWEAFAKIILQRDYTLWRQLPKLFKVVDAPEVTNKEPSFLSFIPRDLIWTWIEEDKGDRAPAIARALFAKPDRIKSWSESFLREFVQRFGLEKDVVDTLHAGFFTDFFGGPESEYRQKQKERLSELLGVEVDSTVASWLSSLIEGVESQRLHALNREERSF